MKKALSLILALVLTISVPVCAFAQGYTDIRGHWAEEGINWAGEQQLMNGVGDGRFDPEGTVLRATLVTVLYRMEGEPAVGSSSAFNDVSIGSWYGKAVNWAASNGIVNGTDATARLFSPETDLTREQAAAIFYRYSNYKGYNTTSRASLLTFEDGVRVNDYAIDALSWAIATEPEALLSGTSATTLDPHGTALRAQLAVILKRYYNYTHHQGSLHTAIEITERYHYKTLSPKLQECYLRMDTAVKKLSTSFWLGKDLTAEDIARIYNSYIEDNPEHFYMGLHYSYKIYDNANVEFLLYYSDGVTSNEETLSAQLKESILTKKARFDEAVHQVLHTIPVGASQPEKEKMIYDWIISNNRYASEVLNWDLDSISESPDELTAYGAMVNGIGVCESYAGAFQVLCHAVGIHCTSIEGTADGMPHKWNAVFLDGEWYFVDPTYGDPLLFDGTNYLDGPIETPIPYYHYDYFNKTTAQTAASHIPDNLLPNPTCTGTKYNYNYFVS